VTVAALSVVPTQQRQHSSLALLQSFQVPTNFQFQVWGLPPFRFPPISTLEDHLTMAILGRFRIDSAAQSLTKVSTRT
jgi:hypothetical protein